MLFGHVNVIVTYWLIGSIVIHENKSLWRRHMQVENIVEQKQAHQIFQITQQILKLDDL